MSTNIRIGVTTTFTCPTYLGIPAVSEALLYIGEYGTSQNQANATNAVSADGAVNTEVLTFMARAPLLDTSRGTNIELSTGTNPGPVSIPLKPRYFVVLFAKQAVSTSASKHYVWYSTVYDLALDPSAGIVSFVQGSHPPDIQRDTSDSGATTSGESNPNRVEIAPSNNLTSRYTRLANLNETGSEATASYIAGCTKAVFDGTVSGYTTSSASSQTIGACADACSASASCMLIEFDTSNGNCKLYSTGIDKSTLATAPNAATAAATTRAQQCWSKNTMFNAVRDATCTTTLTGYDAAPNGCRRRRVAAAPSTDDAAARAAALAAMQQLQQQQQQFCAGFRTSTACGGVCTWSRSSGCVRR